MSQAKRPFPSIRAISRPISTSPFSEDVSGETPMFDIKRLKTKLSISRFWRMSQAKRPFRSNRAISRPISISPNFKDVSGETPISDIKRLKTKLSRSHFLEDVSSKTAILGGIRQAKYIYTREPVVPREFVLYLFCSKHGLRNSHHLLVPRRRFPSSAEQCPKCSADPGVPRVFVPQMFLVSMA